MRMKVEQSNMSSSNGDTAAVREEGLLVFPGKSQKLIREQSPNSTKWALFRDKGKELCMSAETGKMTLRSIWSDKRLEHLVDLEHIIKVRAEMEATENKLLVKKLLVEGDDIRDEAFTQSIIDRLSGKNWAEIPVASTAEELKMLYKVFQDDLSKEMQMWVEQSFRALDSKLGDTEKRHILNALTHLLNIDWRSEKPVVPSLESIKARLDDRFHGMETVKTRILEVAALIRRNGNLPRFGILLHGPAGVGKTSVANAIADILGMPKAYLDFSAAHDVEGLTGSSRVYSNAKPGVVIEQLYQCGTSNTVVVLNEIDKAITGKDGSPLNALLSLLDGHGFRDNFMECSIPTGNMLFVGTANSIAELSSPFLDRFFLIEIPPYSKEEKETIFRRHILSPYRQQEPGFCLSKKAVTRLIEEFATGGGVRDLEKAAEALFTHYLMTKELKGAEEVMYGPNDLTRILGMPHVLRHSYPVHRGTVCCGCIENGKAMLYVVQASVRPGEGKLTILGGGDSGQQIGCALAHEFLLTQMPELKEMDVVLFFDQPMCCGTRNTVGLAAAAAMISYLSGITFPQAIFVGGSDLFGSLYLDESDISPLLKHAMEEDKIIVAPAGAAEVIGTRGDTNSVHMELPSLFSLLMLVCQSGSSELSSGD